MYSDVLMDDPNHLRIFVPSDIDLKCHHLRAYHGRPVGMHHGRDATYNCLSHDVTGNKCINMSETGFTVALGIFI